MLAEPTTCPWKRPGWPHASQRQAQPNPPPARTPVHYCQQHQSEYKRFEKDGRVWYSHKTSDGKWCREK